MDFKDCHGDSFTEIENNVIREIIRAFQSFPHLKISKKKCLGEPIKKLYKKYITDIESGKDVKKCIKDLSMLLCAHHGQKVWILIDEYDAATNQAYIEFDAEEATKVSNLFRDILEPALKGNEFLYKGVLTGVQRIVKSGMLSGVNNLGKYSIQNSKYSQYYGVNQNEMELLWAHFNVSDDRRNKMKQWYNGYQEKVADSNKYIEKYNIWSVINYLNNQGAGLISYWEESASFDFIKNLLKSKEVRDKIKLLVDGGSIAITQLKIDFSVDDFMVLKELINAGDNYIINVDGLDVLFSYLFIAGYLTETSDKKFKFPNQEINHAMRGYHSRYCK